MLTFSPKSQRASSLNLLPDVLYDVQRVEVDFGSLEAFLLLLHHALRRQTLRRPVFEVSRHFGRLDTKKENHVVYEDFENHVLKIVYILPFVSPAELVGQPLGIRRDGKDVLSGYGVSSRCGN